MLGTSWFEHSSSWIEQESGGLAKKIGYEELIDALSKLLDDTGQSPEVDELARAYRNAIQKQFENLKNAFKKDDRGKHFFYSLYWEIQKRLKNLKTAIYTVNNRGSAVYILNGFNHSDHWIPFLNGNVSGELYCEVVNGHLRIKFYSEAAKEDKYEIREKIRDATRKVLGKKYEIKNAGRLGTHMTACQVGHDFSDISKLDDSAKTFQDVASKLGAIIQEITS